MLLLLLMLRGYLYLKFSWLQVSSVSDNKYNAAIVENDSPLPGNFLRVWDKVYPNSRNNGMNKQLWSDLTAGIIHSKYRNCCFDEIGYTAWNNDKINFKVDRSKLIGRYRQFGYGLEYYTSPEKCFTFWINHDIIWNHEYLKDLNELSTICFAKNTKILSDSEIIRLIVYGDRGERVKRQPGEFNKKVKELTERFKKS